VKLGLRDSLDALIQIFVLGDAVPATETASLFPPAVWEAMSHTKLISPDPADQNRYLANVALYPIRDLFIASDRWTNADHSPRPPFADIVYPALTKAAKQFIDFTSFEPCEDFLELCAGTAPAALLAARKAEHVWATDIAERSLDFAKFNAALNGIHNVTFAMGDLYQPVEGRTFDRIAAHPPYVPVLKPAEIFYGGGEVGEEITKRIIAELPGKLKRGGRLYCRTLGTERPGHKFEQRIRDWLGEKNSELDVAFFAIQTMEPRQFALEETLNKNGGREEFLQWERMFARNEVHELVIGIVVIQRATGQRPAFTVRRTIRPNTPLAAIESILRWEAELLEEGATERLLQIRPVATQGIEIISRHVLRDGEIVPERYTLSTEFPFAMDCNVQAWMAMLLPQCNGKTTIAELLELSKQNEWVVPETPAAEFCRLLATLISGGFLQTEESRLPAAKG
jgi:methylase of polypeptide subunit release factors